MSVDAELLERLICPWHGTSFVEDGSVLDCGLGHRFPVVEGVPVILEEGPQTLWVAESSLRHARAGTGGPYYIDTLGIAEHEVAQLRATPLGGEIDPVASFMVGATNGIAYRHLIGKLAEYPIPDLRLPRGNGEVLLDIGCNWGRWCVAAARLGYRPVGLDPSLGAVLAARRVTRQLGLRAWFVVGDARFLPFRDGGIDVAFSYSVLQHFSRADMSATVRQIGRVLARGGRSMIQMPAVLGMRCLYHQARRGFREGRGFEVRYWSLPALRGLFESAVGRTRFSVDCFFGIGLQASDMNFMPASHQAAIRVSEWLRRLSHGLPGLRYLADSVYVESVKR